MTEEQMRKEYDILHEQLIDLREESKKDETTTMEKVEISKAMVELFKITKFSIRG